MVGGYGIVMSERGGGGKTLRNSTERFKRRFQAVRQPVHTLYTGESQPVAVYSVKQPYRLSTEASFYGRGNSRNCWRKTECSPSGRTTCSRGV